VLTTPRLALERLTLADAPFILTLVNDPDWLRYIGDKGVHTLDDARRYLETGPLAMYARDGFGLLRVTLLESGAPIGMCGLLRRDTLPAVDLGFAFLPRHRGQGYAREAAAAVLEHAFGTLGVDRILAIVSFGNTRSEIVLGKLGFRPAGTVRLGAEDLQLFETYSLRSMKSAG
jgi:[ribosomal protein S5]-alanine N-acetyltransferase